MPVVVKFPHLIFVGTDVCRIARVRRILEAAGKREPFVRRVLRPEERGRIDAILGRLRRVEETERETRARGCLTSWLSGLMRRAPAGGGSSPERVRLLCQAAVHMAGRFAAKEAIIKAHPHMPKLSFDQICIHAEPDGAPAAVVTGSGCRPQQARLSISHDGDYATAVCLGFQHVPGGDGGVCVNEVKQKE